MKPRDYRAEPPLWLLWSLFGMLLIVILGMLVTPVWSLELALGDSLALGFGQASGLPTRAVVGEPSCPNRRAHRPGIVNMVPAGHFDFVLLSAGTNDAPGRCIEAIRAKLDADKVQWVVPVNGARSHVLAVAGAHGDATLFYTPGARSWPHPAAYWDVTGRHKAVLHRRTRRHARRH